jgi:uncharacterized protein (TIGR03000 family)
MRKAVKSSGVLLGASLALILSTGLGYSQVPAPGGISGARPVNTPNIFRPPPSYFVYQAYQSQPTRYDITYSSPPYGPVTSPTPSWVPQPYYGYNPRAYPPPTYYYAYFGAGGGGVYDTAQAYPGRAEPGSVPNAVPQAQTDTSVQIVVKVPAGAELWFNGWKTSSTGPVREFQSPSLAPGRYSYDIRARWQENGKEVTQSQRIAVSPGTNTEVNFPSTPGA